MAKVLIQPGVYAEIDESGSVTIAQAYEGPLGQTRYRPITLSTTGAQALLELLATGQGPAYPAEDDSQPE